LITKEGEAMHHRTTGFGFCVIAAALYATRYFAFAILYAERGGRFEGLKQIESLVELNTMAKTALSIGIVYLCVAEVSAYRAREKQIKPIVPNEE